jgi:hypothetical protein
MNRIWTRALAAAGALALAGGTVLTAALPASAAPDADSSAWALDAFGYLTVPPVAEADSFARHVAHQSHFSNPWLFTTAGAAVDTASSGAASSDVALINLRRPGTALALTVRLARSSCSPGVDVPTGRTTIVGGLVGFGGFGFSLPADPAVDQVIDLPGIGTVTLNDQDSSDGHLTVIAMSIQTLLGEVIDIGTSVCQDTGV